MLGMLLDVHILLAGQKVARNLQNSEEVKILKIKKTLREK
jgi:hypothetical protein